MKSSKLFLSAAAAALTVLVTFGAQADHSIDNRQVGRAAGYVKFDAENLLISMTRDRSLQNVQLINKTGMVAKEAHELEQVALRGHPGRIQREAQDVFAAFRDLERSFRFAGAFQVSGGFARLARSVRELERTVYGDGGFDGNDDGFDGNDDGFDGNDDGFPGNDDGFDGNDDGFDGNDDGFDGDDDGHDGNDDGHDGNDDGHDHGGGRNR